MSKIRFELDETDARAVIHALNLRAIEVLLDAGIRDPGLGQTNETLERIADDLQEQSGLWKAAE